MSIRRELITPEAIAARIKTSVLVPTLQEAMRDNENNPEAVLDRINHVLNRMIREYHLHPEVATVTYKPVYIANSDNNSDFFVDVRIEDTSEFYS
jgi:hypothetical protein